MKLTKEQLKKIIKEELGSTKKLKESSVEHSTPVQMEAVFWKRMILDKGRLEPREWKGFKEWIDQLVEMAETRPQIGWQDEPRGVE